MVESGRRPTALADQLAETRVRAEATATQLAAAQDERTGARAEAETVRAELDLLGRQHTATTADLARTQARCEAAQDRIGDLQGPARRSAGPARPLARRGRPHLARRRMSRNPARTGRTLPSMILS
ncbi:hypothetical protein [Streptosporangium sandarakinum]|uniref:hypothetical protein n=1 Tax=Streptosporangium sandarakinum TaxID=1260955 RepID=UPI00339E6600